MTAADPVPVAVVFLLDDRAVEGPGWYCWESECPEEGCFFFSATERPTAEQLRDICPEYVEEQNAASASL